MTNRSTDIVNALAKLGFVFDRRNRHMIYRHPSGAIVSTSMSPSDVNAVRQAVRDAKRALAKARKK